MLCAAVSHNMKTDKLYLFSVTKTWAKTIGKQK
jgi:hypothetical protein